MTTKVTNNSDLSVFTTKLTSVKYKGKEQQLEFWDKAKIYAAFVIGFLFAGIGSPIAGLATSYYLRSRKVEQLDRAGFDLGDRSLEPHETTSMRVNELGPMKIDGLLYEMNGLTSFEDPNPKGLH